MADEVKVDGVGVVLMPCGVGVVLVQCGVGGVLVHCGVGGGWGGAGMRTCNSRLLLMGRVVLPLVAGGRVVALVVASPPPDELVDFAVVAPSHD